MCKELCRLEETIPAVSMQGLLADDAPSEPIAQHGGMCHFIQQLHIYSITLDVEYYVLSKDDTL